MSIDIDGLEAVARDGDTVHVASPTILALIDRLREAERDKDAYIDMAHNMSSDLTTMGEERDALAAHVERISERARVITDSRAWEGNADPRVPHALLNRLSEACMDAPTASLAQRDARVADEALNGFARWLSTDKGGGAADSLDVVRYMVSHQAEEGQA